MCDRHWRVLREWAGPVHRGRARCLIGVGVPVACESGFEGGDVDFGMVVMARWARADTCAFLSERLGEGFELVSGCAPAFMKAHGFVLGLGFGAPVAGDGGVGGVAARGIGEGDL